MAIPLKTAVDVGASIKAGRRRLGIDQAELARRIGASRLWVNQIERGKPRASLNLVLRAFAVLGLDLVAAEPDERDTASELPPLPDLDLNAIVDGRRCQGEP